MAADRLDEATLVWIAAAAARRDPAAVLETADVAALASVVAEVEDVVDPFERAARLTVALVTTRPFATANAAAAWLSAAVVVGEAGASLRMADDDALALLDAVAAGDLGYDDVARAFERASHRPRTAREPVSCPECGRALYEQGGRPSGRVLLPGTSRFELTARCWFEHGAHDRRGRPLPVPGGDAGDDGWRPVIVGGAGDWFVALVDAAAVAFVPAADGAPHVEVVHVADLEAGMLVGSADRVLAAGEPLGAVEASALRFDRRGAVLDWSHVVRSAPPDVAAALAARGAGELVPA